MGHTYPYGSDCAYMFCVGLILPLVTIFPGCAPALRGVMGLKSLVYCVPTSLLAAPPAYEEVAFSPS